MQTRGEGRDPAARLVCRRREPEFQAYLRMAPATESGDGGGCLPGIRQWPSSHSGLAAHSALGASRAAAAAVRNRGGGESSQDSGERTTEQLRARLVRQGGGKSGGARAKNQRAQSCP